MMNKDYLTGEIVEWTTREVDDAEVRWRGRIERTGFTGTQFVGLVRLEGGVLKQMVLEWGTIVPATPEEY